MSFLSLLLFVLGVLAVSGWAGPGLAQAEEEAAPAPVTTENTAIPADQLAILLLPLTREQLLVEAEAWRALVQKKAQQIADMELLAKRQAEAQATIDDAQANAEAANVAVAEAEKALEEARAAGNANAIGEAEEALRNAQEEAENTADTAAAAVQTIVVAGQERTVLLEQIADLRDERTLLIDNLNAVIDELFAKTDQGDSGTQATITDLRLYVGSVSGLRVEVDDVTSAWVAIKEWLTSEQGGIRWATNVLYVAGILLAGWFVSKLISRGLRRAFASRDGTSHILQDFLVGMARWVIMGIAIIMALGALEVSIGPLLAILGAAGFAIAFALQDSLGNIASGILILIFRPFDQGDVVDAGGVSGTVDSLNLVSTTIKTFDNKRMIVPNNKIWNDVITNVTDVTTRRVDLEFGIAYSDDIDRAAEILTEVVAAHDKVLTDPAPVVRVHTLGDSSVNFICRPWVNAADYWTVYWDLMRAVKLRFDAEGINIPFPQRDVHLYVKDGNMVSSPAPVSKTGAASGGANPQPLEIEDSGDRD